MSGGAITAWARKGQNVTLRDYQVVEGYTAHMLRSRVVKAMRDGWRPIGGVAMMYDGKVSRYAQAMVKDEEDQSVLDRPIIDYAEQFNERGK